jgi:hypothetical protein
LAETARILDCSTALDAMASLSGLLGTTPADLRAKWRSFEFDDPRHERQSPEDRLIRYLGYDAEDLPQPHAIRWFHATRAMPGTNFEEGILPTMHALRHIWEAIGFVVARRRWVSEAEWQRFSATFLESDTYGAEQFARKAIAPGWEGPFAFLVRDAAVKGRSAGHRDFTRLSETAEDICLAFEERYKRPLRKALHQHLSPCLVVFTRPRDWPGAVRAALNYAFRADRRLAQNFDCNTCFSGEGEAVPRSWIDRVEWL